MTYVPLPVGDDFDAVLEPLDLGVVLLHFDLELALVVLHAVHGSEVASELVLHVCGKSSYHSAFPSALERVTSSATSHIPRYISSFVH